MARTKQAEAAEKKAAAAKKAEEEKLAAEAAAEAENIADEQPEEEEEEAEMEQEEAVEAEGTATGEAEVAADDAEDAVKKERPPLTEEDHAYIAETLKMKVKLSDDTEADLFSYGPAKFDSPNPDMRPIICHLCRIANVQRPDGLKAHLNGRRHLDKLKRKAINAEKFLEPYRLFYKRDGEKVQQFNIFPGENIETVTPEYESRLVDKIEWDFKPVEDEKLLKKLSEDPVQEYNKTKPVIGLDYILKMKHRDAVKSFCVLCDVYAQPTVYQHVTDAKHQATYIIKHFPSLYEKVVVGLKIADDNRKETALRNIFRKLYRKIEIKHGFKMIKVVHAPEFHSLRARYLNRIRKASHYDENTLEFTDAEVNVLIKKANSNIPFNQPDPPVLTSGVVAPVTPAAAAGRKRGAPPAAVAEAPVIKTRRANESEVELWSKYRGIMPKRLAKLAAQYKKYEQDPKNHPKYQEEWSQFWHARCAQLKKDNIDPDNYNFDKEWLPFWEKRLRKLYHKDVADRKSALRQSFGLPIGRRTPSPSNQPRNMRQPPNQIIRPLPISNNFVPNNNNIGRGDMGQGINRRQRFVQPRMEQQLQQQQPRNRQAPQVRVTREPVSIISVLRLLTALEDQLGSLGPKSVQLLSKAVLCEKNNQNSLELLTDNDYYVLFATAKEKLKGQIMANVIDNSKVRAVTTTVDDLSTLLGIMDKANRSRGPNQQGGRGNNNGNNSFGGGNNYGRQNTGFGGGNANSNFGGGNNGNFRNNNNDDGGNFGNNNNGSGGNYRANDNVGNNSRGGLNDGGNYRNSNNDSGNFRGGFNNNDSGNYRNNSNSNDGNYRGSNDGGNYRSNSNDGGNFRGSVSNIDGGNYRGGNNNNDVGGNYRGGNNDSGFSRGGGNDGGNYRNTSNNNDGGNYRSTDGGNNFGGNNNTASNYRGNDGGNTFSTTSFDGGNNSSSGFATNNSSNINQYRSLGGNNDNFNTKSSSFGGLGSTSNFSSGGGGGGGSNTANQRGNWMGGGGNVYSSLNKPNASSPAFVSGIGGGNNNPQPLMSFDRNTSSNYSFGSVGTRRFNN